MTFAFGSVLAGFGKGKFRDGSAQAAESGEVEFTCSCDAYGVLDNKPMTFAEMMDQEWPRCATTKWCRTLQANGTLSRRWDGGIGFMPFMVEVLTPTNLQVGRSIP